MGRIFGNPSILFDETMLKPELQGMEDFIDGMKNMVETHRRVALLYFEDGSIDLACPPLRAILHYMAHGEWEGHTHPRRRPAGPFSPATKSLRAPGTAKRLERQAAYDRSFWEGPRRATLIHWRMARLFRPPAATSPEQIRKSAGGDPAKVFAGGRGTIGRDQLA